jgi:aspartyl-tRNA(Asn)/glutamyl-tRNA(Gln) amidotransferase subunit A
MTDWFKVSATDLADAYRARKTSPVEVVHSCLDRLDAVNPVLNAVIAMDRTAALAAAQASERRWRDGNALGPLDGVPFTIKDNIVTADLPTTWGSPLYRDFVGAADELPVARMRRAGAVLIGKTNLPELAAQGYTDNPLFGPTGNPWNPALTPGGSSGGAVAAVAAGIGPVALGTDGGGSIRRPASHAGVVGLKPTPGRIPRCDGLPAILLDFEVIGPIARTVADLIVTTQVLSEADPRDPASLRLPRFVVGPTPGVFAPGASAPGSSVPGSLTSIIAPRPRRILFVPRFADHPVDSEIAASVAAAAEVFARLGHNVQQGPAPFDVATVTAIQSTISQSGLAWLMRQHGGASPGMTALQALAASGAGLPAHALFGALDATTRLRRDMSEFFETTDVILTPAAAALPWPKAESHPAEIGGTPVGPRGHAVFTAFANIAGLPGLALPTGFSRDGMPIGLQLVAAPGADAALLSLGLQYEQAHPWADRWPSDPA